MVSRLRSLVDVRAQRIEVTRAGLDALGESMPLFVDAQLRLFGEEGRPGGLLNALLRADAKG